MRAALALALWDIGKREEAETQWGRVDDVRYKDPKWLQSQRHWPPRCGVHTKSLMHCTFHIAWFKWT